MNRSTAEHRELLTKSVTDVLNQECYRFINCAKTMINFTPYLLFDGNCAQAMEFYQSCLGGTLALMRVSESPMKNRMPNELQNRVINARLKSGPIDISASDWLHPTRAPKQGNTLCLYISGAPSLEIRGYFDKLSAESDQTLLDPLREMPFGSYGALTDKFGVRWMFQGNKAA